MLSPRELFPWLSAGVSLQLRREVGLHHHHPQQQQQHQQDGGAPSSRGVAVAAAAADSVFLIVSDKTFVVSVLFRDKRRSSIDIAPHLVKWARGEEERSSEEADDHEEEEEEGKRRRRGALTISYGHRFVLDELSMPNYA